MYRLTAVTAAFGAMLHGIAFVLGQFAADVQPQFVCAVFYLVLSVYLFMHKRWAAWATFFVALTSLIVGLLSVNNGSHAPDSVFYATAVLGVIAASCALILLWNSKPASSA